MKKIESFDLIDSFGLSGLTVEDLYNIDGACQLYDTPATGPSPAPIAGPQPGRGKSGC